MDEQQQVLECLINQIPFPKTQVCILVEGNAEALVITPPAWLADGLFSVSSTLIGAYAVLRGIAVPMLQTLDSAQRWPIIGAYLRQTELDDYARAFLRSLNWAELQGVPRSKLKPALKDVLRNHPNLQAEIAADPRGKEHLLQELEARGVPVNQQKPEVSSLLTPVAAPAPAEPAFTVNDFWLQKRLERTGESLAQIQNSIAAYEKATYLSPEQDAALKQLYLDRDRLQSQQEEIRAQLP